MKKRKLNLKHLGISMIAIIVVFSLVFLFLHPFASTKQAPKPKAKKTTEKTTQQKVSFVAVGDNLIHERVFNYAKSQSSNNTYNFKPVYQHVKPYISKKDLAYVNQETIIDGDELGIQGYPDFNSPSQLADDLIDTGFNLVNGATNHSYDQGLNAVFNTCKLWRTKPNVLFAGLYDSQEDRDHIRTIEKNGIKFSFLAYTFGVNQEPKARYRQYLKDVQNYPYFIGTLDKEKIKQDVAKAKQESDFVIVSAHFGKENSSELGESQIEYAQFFADLDVDLVVGNHSHIVQPVNWLEHNGHQTLVVYSLGNFVSTMDNVDNQLEGMLSLDFIKDNNTYSIENVTYTPLINHYNANVVTIYTLKNYNNDLLLQHDILKNDPSCLQQFQEKIKSIVPDGVKINM